MGRGNTVSPCVCIHGILPKVRSRVILDRMSGDMARGVPDMGMAARLRAARERTGMSQRDFSHSIGVARNTVNNAECGRTVPTRAVVTLWAMATGVGRDWLATGEAPADPGGESAGASSRRRGHAA